MNIYINYINVYIISKYLSDMKADAFLTLGSSRFVARRGLLMNIYTDCGTHFVAASYQLRALVSAPGY